MTESTHHRSTRRLLRGALLAAVAAVTILAVPVAASAVVFNPGGYMYVDQWGSSGTAAGQFSPSILYGVALNHHGAVYVCDTGNSRIQEFSTDGSFIRSFGSLGAGPGQLNWPFGICVDSAGFVYVADFNNNRVEVFDASGAYVRQIGSAGGGDGQLNVPSGIGVDAAGNVSVADYGNNRIEVFDSSGAWVRTLTGAGSPFGGALFGLAVDASGSVYVPDFNNYRIQVFDSSGAYVTQWSTPDMPSSVAIGPDGHVFVGLYYSGYIYEYTSDGTYVRTIGSGYGTGDGQFTQVVYGMDLNAAGTLFAADGWGTRVEKFAYDGAGPIVGDNGDDAWHSIDTTVNFTATDTRAGVDYIEYSLNGGSWTTGTYVTLPAPANHSFDGMNSVQYHAVDNLGNWSPIKTCLIKIDTRKPVTLASNVPTRWVKGPWTIHLSPTDVGSGVTGTWCDVTAVLAPITLPTTPLPDDGNITLTGSGHFTITYYSADGADPPNAEDMKTIDASLDSERPVPIAKANVLVKHDRLASLKYAITDTGGSSTCVVKIVIKKGTKIVRTIKCGAQTVFELFPVTSWHTKSFACTLPTGLYTWSVYATDLAGNTQLAPAVKKLVVY
jgi:sugar lactone lactonase YvrE